MTSRPQGQMAKWFCVESIWEYVIKKRGQKNGEVKNLLY